MRIALFVTEGEQRQDNPMTDGRAVKLQMATTRLMIMIQMPMMMIIEIITIIQWQIKELCTWLQLPALACSSNFSTGGNIKTV